MFERIAVEPSAFLTPGMILMASQHFGLDRGKLAAELPREWMRRVYEVLERFPDGIEKRAAKEQLARLKRHAFVRCGFPYEPSLGWVENARRAKLASHVEGIVVEHSTRQDEPDLMAYITQSQAPHIDLIRHTLDGFASGCRRFLEMVPRVVLVDPYLDLTRVQCSELFEAFIDWGQAGKCEEFVVFCRAEDSLRGRLPSEYEQYVRRFLASLSICRPLRVTVNLLNDKGSTRSPMHRRVMLGAEGGLAVDYGFKLEKNRESDVTVLAGRPLHELQKMYFDGQHPFDVEHAFSWSTAAAVG